MGAVDADHRVGRGVAIDDELFVATAEREVERVAVCRSSMNGQ
jgi:hypothetical protein